jgi:hypothetical protein
MAENQSLSPSLHKLVQEVAEKVVVELYGPDGAPVLGTLFDAIETAGVNVGDAVARAVIEQAAQRQANQFPAERCRCGVHLEDPGQEPKALTTRRGDVGWREPSGYCPTCRRAFFPSGPSVGSESG